MVRLSDTVHVFPQPVYEPERITLSDTRHEDTAYFFLKGRVLWPLSTCSGGKCHIHELCHQVILWKVGSKDPGEDAVGPEGSGVEAVHGGVGIGTASGVTRAVPEQGVVAGVTVNGGQTGSRVRVPVLLGARRAAGTCVIERVLFNVPPS